MTVMATKRDCVPLVADLSAIGCPIVVGFKATGKYHSPLARRLLSAGLELCLISLVALARTREAFHNGRGRNSSKDAQVILRKFLQRTSLFEKQHGPAGRWTISYEPIYIVSQLANRQVELTP